MGANGFCKSYVQAGINFEKYFGTGERLRWAAEAIYMLFHVLSAWPCLKGHSFDDFTMSVLHLPVFFTAIGQDRNYLIYLC